MAYRDYFNQVQDLYIAYYQRPADPAGLVYWAQRLDAAGGSLEGIIDAFATSPESQRLYGTINSQTIGTVIDNIYRALFNRAPDAAGRQYYIDGFNEGRFTPGTIVLDILNGAQGADRVAIMNKEEASMYFTKVLDPELDGVGPFSATYDQNDEATARQWLAGITADSSTRVTEAVVRQAIYERIADPGDPIKSSFHEFYLTSGLDKIVGTSGDDTFFGNASTAQAGDVIDGGQGNDLLRLTSTGTIPQISNIETVWVSDFGGNVSVSGIAGVNTLKVTDSQVVRQGATSDYFYGLSGQDLMLQNLVVDNANLHLNTAAGVKELSVALDNVHTINSGNLDIFSPGLQTLKLNVTGHASDIMLNDTGGGLQNLNIAGDAAVKIDSLVANLKVDGSANSGGITLEGAQPDSFIGGSGTDTLLVDKNYTENVDKDLQAVENIVIVNPAGLTVDVRGQSEGFHITGGAGNDVIHDGQGGGVIIGGAGNDIIYGHGGADELQGGPGSDWFVFDDFRTADHVRDFEPGKDRIYLDLARGMFGTNLPNAIGFQTPVMTAKTAKAILKTGAMITITLTRRPVLGTGVATATFKATLAAKVAKSATVMGTQWNWLLTRGGSGFNVGKFIKTAMATLVGHLTMSAFKTPAVNAKYTVNGMFACTITGTKAGTGWRFPGSQKQILAMATAAVTAGKDLNTLTISNAIMITNKLFFSASNLDALRMAVSAAAKIYAAAAKNANIFAIGYTTVNDKLYGVWIHDNLPGAKGPVGVTISAVRTIADFDISIKATDIYIF